MMAKDFDASLITDQYYLGDMTDASNLAGLTEQGITHILCVADSIDPATWAIEHPLNQSITRHYIPLNDFGKSKLDEVFDQCFEFIEKGHATNCKVLVHCVAGINRSASITMAYLMKKNNWTFEQAYTHVRGRRSQVFPHMSYVSQLLAYETHLYGSCSYEMPRDKEGYFRNIWELKKKA
eukprot:TRINITY_DN13654_c0_g1_i1.p1 TRINITY_DN13654_c0_g1~~TRINITY_DN13654_c0_g1_i1.p1  ORF type:complete len:180 (-),score=17.19 TRINITY_DN13654_c0_g1_i1:85-624(-)